MKPVPQRVQRTSGETRPGQWARNAVLVVIAVISLTACGGGGSTGSAASPTGSVTPAGDQLHLVAVGDSIPNNSPNDCPGCDGFVDRYARTVEAAVGRPVTVTNLSQHNNLTLPGLLDELSTFDDQLGAADVIVVGIAHNTIELNADRPCGGGRHGPDDALPDWAKLTPACAKASTARYRPQFDALFSKIVAVRAGKPTIFRTINRYNDYVGWPQGHLTAAENQQTTMFLDAWNDMLCQSAGRHGFTCADVYRAFNGSDGSKPSGLLLAKDYTHPSDAGNAKIAAVLDRLGYAPLS